MLRNNNLNPDSSQDNEAITGANYSFKRNYKNKNNITSSTISGGLGDPKRLEEIDEKQENSNIVLNENDDSILGVGIANVFPNKSDNSIYNNNESYVEDASITDNNTSNILNTSNNSGSIYGGKAKSDYFSMSSNVIQSCNVSKFSIHEDEADEDNYIEELNNMNLNMNVLKQPNVFMQKECIVFYFEINYLMVWVKDYLKSTFPELNFILVIEIDDNKETQEKIFLTKTKDNNKYIPLLKKEDTEKNYCRVLKVVNKDDAGCMNTPHKISLQLCTYARNKLIVISEEDMFIQIKSENQMNKYKFYKNMNMKYNNKKIGNVLFNFVYKKENVNNDINITNFEEDYRVNNLETFSKIEKFSTYKDEHSLPFIYHNIKNISIKPNGSSKESTCGSGSASTNNFFSINDIEDVEISGELKGEKLNLDRLLELLGMVKKKYEFYEVLSKLNSYISKRELDEDRLYIFKEKILKRIEEISESKDLYDRILIPYIFVVLKNLFFKSIPKTKNNFRRKSITSKESMELDENEILLINNDIEIEIQNNSKKEKNIVLLLDAFKFSFKFIINTNNTNIDYNVITLAALNYIFKILDDNNKFEYNTNNNTFSINNEPCSLEEYLANFIIKNKYDTLLLKILMSNHHNQACVQPITGIFSKILKMKKLTIGCSNILTIFTSDVSKEIIKDIIKIHSVNSTIMTNIMCILYYSLDVLETNELLSLVDFIQLKDIFTNFRMNGFDLIHESIIFLIKGLLMKKSNKISNQNTVNMTITTNDNYSLLNDEAYSELLTIFSIGLQLLKAKITSIEISKLGKWTFNLMTIIYTMTNIINNINSKHSDVTTKICKEKRIAEWIIEVLYSIYEKNLFYSIDKLFEKLDACLLNTKMMIFRTLFHCVMLIKGLGIKTLPKQSAEKIYKVVKNIEDNDISFNPMEIFKKIEKNYKNNANQENFKNLINIQKMILDFYSRYKSNLPEFIKEIIYQIKHS